MTDKQRHPGGRPPTPHTPQSEGVRLLTKWLADHGLTQADLARLLDVSRPRLSRITRDVVKPRPALAMQIAELTGNAVPKHTWHQDAGQSSLTTP